MKTIIVVCLIFAGFYATKALPQSNPTSELNAQTVPLTLMGHTLGESEATSRAVVDAICQKEREDLKVAEQKLMPNTNLDQYGGEVMLKYCVKDRLEELTFEAGKLVEFKGRVRGQGEQGNEIVLADAVKKLGQPTLQTILPYHNGFGAQWNDRITEWSLSNGTYVLLIETNDPTSHFVGAPLIEFESQKRHEFKEAEKATRPNSLN
jgi:hypothetical protein